MNLKTLISLNLVFGMVLTSCGLWGMEQTQVTSLTQQEKETIIKQFNVISKGLKEVNTNLTTFHSFNKKLPGCDRDGGHYSYYPSMLEKQRRTFNLKIFSLLSLGGLATCISYCKQKIPLTCTLACVTLSMGIYACFKNLTFLSKDEARSTAQKCLYEGPQYAVSSLFFNWQDDIYLHKQPINEEITRIFNKLSDNPDTISQSDKALLFNLQPKLAKIWQQTCNFAARDKSFPRTWLRFSDYKNSNTLPLTLETMNFLIKSCVVGEIPFPPTTKLFDVIPYYKNAINPEDTHQKPEVDNAEPTHYSIVSNKSKNFKVCPDIQFTDHESKKNKETVAKINLKFANLDPKNFKLTNDDQTLINQLM